MHSIDAVIREEIARLDEGFRENELAYLSLTGKIEIPLRDKLAFKLYERLPPNGLTVFREWQRIDLAVLDLRGPVVLLEFKAMVTFDCCGAKVHRNRNQYPELMYRDLIKVRDFPKTRRMGTKRTSIYSILFATHPLGKVSIQGKSKEYKYFAHMNRALEMYKDPESVLEKCNTTLRAFLHAKGLEISLAGSLPAGECFGTKVEVPYWVVGPLTMDSLRKA